VRGFGQALLVWMLVAVVFAVIVTQLDKVINRPCELHSYTVVRFNPAIDFMIRPARIGEENARLLLTEVLACSYENVGGDHYRFSGRETADTLTGVVHVQDKGVLR
jgi:hypothetical protein